MASAATEQFPFQALPRELQEEILFRADVKTLLNSLEVWGDKVNRPSFWKKLMQVQALDIPAKVVASISEWPSWWDAANLALKRPFGKNLLQNCCCETFTEAGRCAQAQSESRKAFSCPYWLNPTNYEGRMYRGWKVQTFPEGVLKESFEYGKSFAIYPSNMGSFTHMLKPNSPTSSHQGVMSALAHLRRCFQAPSYFCLKSQVVELCKWGVSNVMARSLDLQVTYREFVKATDENPVYHLMIHGQRDRMQEEAGVLKVRYNRTDLRGSGWIMKTYGPILLSSLGLNSKGELESDIVISHGGWNVAVMGSQLYLSVQG